MGGAMERIVALAGNPNVGKSTVFNSLTGMRQHTGNWPGKTVAQARGRYEYEGCDYLMVDLPGTYSLTASSLEEEIARDFLCFEKPDATVVVADATCLERNLILTLQVMEVAGSVILCVNLMDEARKKGLEVDLKLLAARLHIPVVGTSARNGEGLRELKAAIRTVAAGEIAPPPRRIPYGEAVEQALAMAEPAVRDALGEDMNSRWAALRLMDGDKSLLAALQAHLGRDILKEEAVAQGLAQAAAALKEAGIPPGHLQDHLTARIVEICQDIAGEAVLVRNERYRERDLRADRVLTSRHTGIPLMVALLLVIFWLTITGANAPSAWLSQALFSLLDPLKGLLRKMAAPEWLTGLVADGAYRTLAWVVSVMLPPMAIFFPLFTLLEDLGYLPRVAFNMDHFFRRACAHGKQALTMCMGFGCNACGVTGCRIIDSPRERLIAILTNSFVPCNGRFPILITVITLFFAGSLQGWAGSAASALALTGAILLSVGMTLLVSRLLSRTILKGIPSSFQLELPPYRLPRAGQVIVRSILDRTLFVLGRAVTVSAPAGLVIWLMANLQTGGASALAWCAGFLDPLGRLMGMDGYILMAFILGLPANELVMPILIMSYLAAGTLTEAGSMPALYALLTQHGWTWLTALCVLMFSLMHWPCGTTLLTIRRETGKAGWTLAAFLLPTLTGAILCGIVAAAARLMGLA